MFKKLFTIIAVIGLFFSVSAQNARVDAMGGCDIIDDIIGILGNPADMNDFEDQIQVTGSPTAFGPAIGIKSLGRNFNIGAMANMTPGSGSSVLRGDFYSSAEAVHEANLLLPTPVDLPSSFPTYPHLLFGLNFGSFALGIDAFLEIAKYKSVDDNGGDETERSASISNFGAIVSVNIELGDVTISPLFGIGAPKAIGTNEDLATTSDVETDKNLLLSAGSELGLELRDLNIFGGFFYRLEKYRFEVGGTNGDENKESFIDAYLGLIADVSNGLLFVTQYNFTIGSNKAINSDDDFNKLTDLFHDFRFGFERPISGIWIFDDIVPRAGIRYTIGDTARLHIENDGGDTLSSSNNPNYSTQVQLTAGLGVTKGIAAIDLAVRIGSWDGVLTGPNVISGTVTLDFGKRGSSYESGRESRPSPSPVYESDESDYQSDDSDYQTDDSDYQTEPEPTDETTPTEEKDSDTDFNF